jgi:hypothetical protein
VGDRSRPVILDVRGELLHRDVGRCIAITQRDVNRAVHVVGEVRIEDRALPVLNVMNSLGSLTKFTPALKS